MDLLQYEFKAAQVDSYYGILAQLIKKVRYYLDNIPADEFSRKIPELRVLEAQLHETDSSIGLDKRIFIKDIVDELIEENAMKERLLTEVDRSAKAISLVLYDGTFSLDDFAFEYKNTEAVYWLIFYGYNDQRKADSSVLVVKEVFRSICNREGIVFIDSSLEGK